MTWTQKHFRASLGVLLLFGAGPALAASSPWASSDVSQVRLLSATLAVGDAARLQLGLQFQLNPGWKIYWRSPGDSGSPPRLDLAGSENIVETVLHWPAPQRFHEAAGLETVGYKNQVVLPLTVIPARPGAPVTVRATVDYQACEVVCVPMTAVLSLTLPVGPAAPSPFFQLIERNAARVPGVPEAAAVEIAAAGAVGQPPAQTLLVVARSPVPFSAPDLFVEASSRYRLSASVASLSGDRTEARLQVAVEARGDRDLVGQEVAVTLVDGDRAVSFPLTVAAVSAPPVVSTAKTSLWAILGLALLGGLILNLMPCVLPVLSLKILGAISHGGGERRRVSLGFLASAAGIVASFLLLAATAVAVKLAGGAVGWGIQFQQPLFLIFLVLVVGLFAFNLVGLFEMRLPGWLGDLGLAAGSQGKSAGGLVGNFITGAFATLLATPCSAPFLGTAVGFALVRGAPEIFAVFVALGIGMAAPYLLVAVFPGLATGLPRPGPWMLRLRCILALALVATVVWLLWVLEGVAGLSVAFGAAVAVVALGALCWLRQARPEKARAALGAMALAVIFAFAVPGWLLTAGGRGGDEMTAVFWQPFDIVAIGEAVAAGKTVFVDVTADWCVTCKVNKRLVIADAAVRARLEGSAVVCMRADWTRPDPAIATYLASFGRYGIPFNVVYGPASRYGLVLPELLSTGAVLEALDAAGDV